MHKNRVLQKEESLMVDVNAKVGEKMDKYVLVGI